MTTGSTAPYNEQQNFPVLNSAIYMFIKTDALIENLEQSIAQDSPGNTIGRLKPRAHIHSANIRDSYKIHKPLRKRRGYLEIHTRGSAEWMKLGVHWHTFRGLRWENCMHESRHHVTWPV